jgi:hypothetical protein
MDVDGGWGGKDRGVQGGAAAAITACRPRAPCSVAANTFARPPIRPRRVTARRYEKPCDVTKKKVKLLTVKPLFLHLNLSGASPFFPRFVRLPQRALPPHCFLLLLPFTRPLSPKFRPVTPQQQVNVKSPSFVRANTAVVPRLLFPYVSTAALKPNDTRRR